MASAVVARTRSNTLEYLVRSPGADKWAENADVAARYQNLREATREAMRLPSGMRAFALPIDSLL
jgi:hypothetical protein